MDTIFYMCYRPYSFLKYDFLSKQVFDRFRLTYFLQLTVFPNMTQLG